MASPAYAARKRGGRSTRFTALAAILLAISALAPASPSSAIETAAAGPPCSTQPDVECALDIPYIDDGSPAHTLDVFYPAHLTDRAAVVLIHGGRWMNNSSRTYDPEAMYFAENGFAAFSINYTLSQPGSPSWPQVRTDVETATAWVMQHADAYHGDDARVAVLGGSSGGHLAALVDTDGPEHGAAPIAAVTWSAMMDLKMTYKDGNGAARNGLIQLLGCKPHECPQTYADASPVTHVASGDGSLLFFHSAEERVPIAQAREMNRALKAAGVPHRLVVLKHSTEHAREYECAHARVDGHVSTVIDDSLRWLGHEMGQPTTPTGSFCASSRPRTHR